MKTFAMRGSMPAMNWWWAQTVKLRTPVADGRVENRLVAEELLAGEDRDDLGRDADRRQQHDVDLGVTEEPEEVLPEDRVTAAVRVEERRPERLVEEQHDAAGEQRPDREHEEDARDHDHPDDHRDVVHLHAGRARVHRGRDEVDTAQQERDELERDRSKPERRAKWRQVVLRLRGERRIGGPGATEAAAFDEEGRQQDDRAEQEDLIREPVDLREDHVVRADHQRDQEVPEGGDQDGHRDPEDHDRAVVRDQRVVLAGRDLPKPGTRCPGRPAASGTRRRRSRRSAP